MKDWALVARPSGRIEAASAARIAAALGSLDVTLHVTEAPPPRLTLVPFQRRPVALVTATTRQAIDEARAALSPLGPTTVFERTTEVVVPPRGDITLLTLFRQRPGLPRPEFLRRWYEEHTPMTLEIHPVTGYVRGTVEARLSGDESWDGIVTEDFAARSDVTSLRLFGRGPSALQNAIRVGLHIRTFLDLTTLETFLVRRLR